MPLIGKFNVAEVSFNFSCLIVLVLYVQVEAYYFLCYNNFVFFNKTLTLASTQKMNFQLANYTDNTLYFVVLFLCLFSYKHGTIAYCNLAVVCIVFLFLLSKILKNITNFSNTNNSVYLILPSFAVFLYSLSFIKSLLVFLFLVELYGALYYFCFLSSYNFTNQTLLKYKNGVLFLLWNNFLTTIFLTLGCFWALRNLGTTDFYELNLLSSGSPYLYFFIVGIFWKLGLPIFHFLKLEIYKYLLRENVFLFSILTTLINIVILFVLVSQPIILNTLLLYNWVVVLLLFSILLSLVNLNLTNVLQFFAYSSIFTVTTVLTVFTVY